MHIASFGVCVVVIADDRRCARSERKACDARHNVDRDGVGVSDLYERRNGSWGATRHRRATSPHERGLVGVADYVLRHRLCGKYPDAKVC